MEITSQFIEKSAVSNAESKPEHLTCTIQERDAALIRLYQNIHSKDEIKTILGRKYKTNIVDLFTLCNSLKYMFFKPETVMPLSTTGALSETFGNYKKVSRVIDWACQIGLLEEVNGKYSYCSASTKSIHFKPNAKEYVCNREVIKVIEEICKEEEIIKEDKENRNTNISIYSNTVADTFASNLDYKITSKTLIDDTDENVLSGLYNHYVYMKEFQELANRINENAVLNSQEQIKFQFNITRGKSGQVTKIGCRATNAIVNLKEHENENQNYKGVWRKDYLEAVLGEGYEEFDVHSSISNVNYLLNHGEWLGIDCYGPEFGRPFDDVVSRDWYKSIFMRLYFNKSVDATAKSIIADIEYRKTQECRTIIESLKTKMTNFIGEQYGSEIFFHESCIYLLVRKVLMERGIQCSQVYDGFYFKKGEMPEDMDKIVKACAELYYAKYFIGEKNMEKKEEITKDMWSRFVAATKPANQDIEEGIPSMCVLTGVPGEWCQECSENGKCKEQG